MGDWIYERDRATYRPTKWAGSPWSRSMQHGGPVNALFAREIECLAAGAGLQVARLTIDLFKAVPMEPLVAETRFVRQGKRIAAVESTLRARHDEAPVCRASGLLLRPSEHDHSSWETPELTPPPPDQTDPPARPAGDRMPADFPPGYHEKVQIRAGFDEVGPYVWMTTPLDLVAGETITPLQRATGLTDMTLGTQMRMAARRRTAAAPGEDVPQMGALMINTDTTVYWERPVVGDSLGLRPSLITETGGVGTAEAILYDRDGRVGRSMQSALVQAHFGRSTKP